MDAFDDQFVLPFLRQAVFEGQSEECGQRFFSAPDIDLSDYDHFVLGMSGGKDSISCLLHLMDCGVDRSRIELWHHDVDGREGSTLMDWVFMRDYNLKLGETFGVPVYFSWLQGGFEGEMNKSNGYSQPHWFETPDGLIKLDRDLSRMRPATRKRFPQVSASLQTRWCSSALKIDVGRRALTNQSRFDGKRVLFITGERREESAGRSKYYQFEPHVCDRRNGRARRHVDVWRPVLELSEEQIWAKLEAHRVLPPVPYRLNFSRSSCMTCIFNGPRIWATILKYFPERIERISEYETEFGVTIARSGKNVMEIAKRAVPFLIEDIEALDQAMRQDYVLDVLASEGQEWTLPPGAFAKEGCGAT